MKKQIGSLLDRRQVERIPFANETQLQAVFEDEVEARFGAKVVASTRRGGGVYSKSTFSRLMEPTSPSSLSANGIASTEGWLRSSLSTGASSSGVGEPSSNVSAWFGVRERGSSGDRRFWSRSGTDSIAR